jgi:hypothetical protein
MVCTGAKSEEDSRLAARKYARIIQKLGFPVSWNKNFTILLTMYYSGVTCISQNWWMYYLQLFWYWQSVYNSVMVVFVLKNVTPVFWTTCMTHG